MADKEAAEIILIESTCPKLLAKMKLSPSESCNREMGSPP